MPFGYVGWMGWVNLYGTNDLAAVYFNNAETWLRPDSCINRNHVSIKAASTFCNNNHLFYYYISHHNAITFRPLFNHICLSTVKLGMILAVLQSLVVGLQFACSLGIAKQVENNLFCELMRYSDHLQLSSPSSRCKNGKGIIVFNFVVHCDKIKLYKQQHERLKKEVERSNRQQN